MADDWLAIASQEVAYIPVDILIEACGHARRTCHHHGKIIPTIVAYSDPVIDQRRRSLNAARAAQMELIPKEFVQRWTPTEEEIEAIKRQTAANLDADRGATRRSSDWPE